MNSIESNQVWWKVCSNPLMLADESRLHTCIDGRYITIIRHKGKLSALDSICYHASGPLGLGHKDMDNLL